MNIYLITILSRIFSQNRYYKSFEKSLPEKEQQKMISIEKNETYQKKFHGDISMPSA